MSSNRQENLRQMREAHRRNLQRSLEHRMAVARAKGDERLVRILEAEAEYIG